METINIKVLESELTTGTVEWVKNFLEGGALKVTTLNDGSPGVQLIRNANTQDSREKILLAFVDAGDYNDSYVHFGNGIWGAYPTNFHNEYLGGVFSKYLTKNAKKLIDNLVEHAVEILTTELEKEETEYTLEFHT